MTNEECIERFMLEYQHRLEITTLYNYFYAIRDFLEFSGKSFNSVTARDIRKWILDLENKQCSPGTINNKIFSLRTFYKFCMEDEYVKSNPTVSINPVFVPEKPIYYLRLNQLNQLRKLVEDDIRMRALIEVSYSTGMRISEVLAMKKADINWSDRFIVVPKAKRKKARIVCFTKECAEYLNAYLSERNDDSPYVFINRMNDGPICARTIHRYFEDYSIQLEFKLTPHTLRGTFSAHLAQKGMPLSSIQLLLGHERPEQTKYYARLFNDARKDIYDQMT